VVALRKSKRSAIIVSPMPEPPMPEPAVPIRSDDMGSLRAPALIAFFASEEILVRAWRPIRIFEFVTEVLRFTGDKKPYVYILETGLWGYDSEKIKRAFEEQAIAKIIGWGWKCDKGTKRSLLLQTNELLGQDIQNIEVGGYKINCVLAPDKGCCCCREKHDCFREGSKCKRFMRG